MNSYDMTLIGHEGSAKTSLLTHHFRYTCARLSLVFTYCWLATVSLAGLGILRYHGYIPQI